MERVYNNINYVIERGLERGMTAEAKLILLGQMHYAMTRGDLTIREVRKLEKALGTGLEDHGEAMSFAVFGDAGDGEENLQGVLG